MGKFVQDVEGCYFPEWETQGFLSKESYEQYLKEKATPLEVA